MLEMGAEILSKDGVDTSDQEYNCFYSHSPARQSTLPDPFTSSLPHSPT